MFLVAFVICQERLDKSVLKGIPHYALLQFAYVVICNSKTWPTHCGSAIQVVEAALVVNSRSVVTSGVLYSRTTVSYGFTIAATAIGREFNSSVFDSVFCWILLEK